MKEKISVVIPAYNIQNYLKAALNSVSAQTYRDLEILVVDDGSTDGTAEVAQACADEDPRIRVICKANGGVTSARLRGVAEATGQYIGFVDGDDYIEPQMYERLLRNLKEHSADVSHCGYRMVFPGGRADYYYNTGKLIVQKGKQGCADLLNGYFVEPGLVNKLFRRELFGGLENWMDASIRINEDLLMNFYLFRQAGTAVFEDVCPYHYVLRKGSAATSGLNAHKLNDPLKVLHRLLKETEPVSQWHKIVQRRLAYQLVNSATMPLGEQEALILPVRTSARRELRRRMWEILSGDACGMKLKLLAMWAAVWPGSYCWAHVAYAKARGTDRKYNVD